MSVQKLQALELAQYKISDVADFLESAGALSANILAQLQTLQSTLEIEMLEVEGAI
jgi:hypothetical protein